MRKLEVKHRPIKFACVFCNYERLELVDPDSLELDAPVFLADVNGDGKIESMDFLVCRCGAEFHWMRSINERPEGVPNDYAILPVGVALKGWKLFAVKEPLLVKTYTLHRKRPPYERSWMQRIIRIPSNFKLIQDGAFFSYHAPDGSIVLKPAKLKAQRESERK
jgi:hypothetical protein